MAKILIVDDEIDILRSIEYHLSQEGYEIKTCMDGVLAMSLYESYKPDLIILDIMLPGMDGWDICRKIREDDKKTVILMLTARTSEDDAVKGLELGADDYIQKPVRLKELTLRVKSHIKDSITNAEDDINIQAAADIITLGNAVLNAHERYLQCDDQTIELSQREFDLLHKLASNPNRVFSREQLLEEVWGWSYIGETRTVDVHIRYLREKLESLESHHIIIKTVRGLGYKLVVE